MAKSSYLERKSGLPAVSLTMQAGRLA